MQSLLDGYRGSAMLYVAGKLGIPDLLAGGPRSSEELARSVEADAMSMHRFLRGLVVYGICREGPNGRFALTELGTWLQDAKSHSMRGQAIRSRETYVAWGSLLHSVMTGETAFTHVFGGDVWNYRSRAELDESFNRAFRQDGERIVAKFLMLMTCRPFARLPTSEEAMGPCLQLSSEILLLSPACCSISLT
jgi:hypothetical protein